MGKVGIRALLVAMTMTLLVVSSAATRAEDGRKYIFGIMVSSSKQDAQLKQIFTDVIDFVAAAQGVDIETRWYTKGEEFLAAAKNKELDFAYTKLYDPFVDLVFKYNYIPISSISVFGKKTMRICLYVPAEMDVKSVDDLKGKRLITYARKDGYYPVRGLLGEKPQDFFSEIGVSNGGNYAIEKMLKGETDAVMAYDINVDFLGMSNPAVAKKIKEVFCSRELVNTAITHAEGVPDAMLMQLIDIMKHARRHEALKRYRPLMAATKIGFFPVKKKNYYGVRDFYKKGKDAGWDKEFEKWYDDMGRPEQ